MTPQQQKDLDRRVCEVLRGLLPDADPGEFAGHAAMLSGFIRGEIREALYHASQAAPALPEASTECPQCHSNGEPQRLPGVVGDFICGHEWHDREPAGPSLLCDGCGCSEARCDALKPPAIKCCPDCRHVR